MTGDTVEGPDIPGPREQSFTFAERQVFIEIAPEGEHAHSLVTLAWTILSVAYSEGNDATIDVIDPNRPQGFICIRLHLESGQSIKEIQSQLQQKIHEGNEGSNTETCRVAQETPQYRSGLPKTLIATEINDTVQRLVLKRNYVLAITCQANRPDGRSLILRGYKYSSKLDDRDLQNVLNRVANLVTQLGAGRDQTMGDFDLMCASDMEQLGVWNEFMPPTLDACVHELIELQSKLHPRNEAVCAWDGSFSYEELNRRATVLARKLVSRGVRIGSYVPLMFEKSKWHIVSLLAVGNCEIVCSITMQRLTERNCRFSKLVPLLSQWSIPSLMAASE